MTLNQFDYYYTLTRLLLDEGFKKEEEKNLEILPAEISEEQVITFMEIFQGKRRRPLYLP